MRDSKKNNDIWGMKNLGENIKSVKQAIENKSDGEVVNSELRTLFVRIGVVNAKIQLQSSEKVGRELASLKGQLNNILMECDTNGYGDLKFKTKLKNRLEKYEKFARDIGKLDNSTVKDDKLDSPRSVMDVTVVQGGQTQDKMRAKMQKILNKVKNKGKNIAERARRFTSRKQ